MFERAAAPRSGFLPRAGNSLACEATPPWEEPGRSGVHPRMKTLALLAGLSLLAPSCAAPDSAAHAPRNRPAEPASASLEVVPLKHAVAAQTAAVLKNMLRDVRIVADERTNSLVVAYEDSAAFAEFERAVAELDIEVPAKP